MLVLLAVAVCVVGDVNGDAARDGAAELRWHGCGLAWLAEDANRHIYQRDLSVRGRGGGIGDERGRRRRRRRRDEVFMRRARSTVSDW